MSGGNDVPVIIACRSDGLLFHDDLIVEQHFDMLFNLIRLELYPSRKIVFFAYGDLDDDKMISFYQEKVDLLTRSRGWPRVRLILVSRKSANLPSCVWAAQVTAHAKSFVTKADLVVVDYDLRPMLAFFLAFKEQPSFWQTVRFLEFDEGMLVELTPAVQFQLADGVNHRL